MLRFEFSGCDICWQEQSMNISRRRDPCKDMCMCVQKCVCVEQKEIIIDIGEIRTLALNEQWISDPSP